MSQKFDPITGEPIIDGGAQNVVGFDPITGHPMTGEVPQAVVGFSPIIEQPMTEAQNSVSSPAQEVVYQSQTSGGFDPMTGKPIGSTGSQSRASGGFDPMTGKPIGSTGSQNQASGGFDPMTGKPIGSTGNQSQVSGGFDPMTGKPIGNTGNQSRASGGFDPMTGKPLNRKEKAPKQSGGKNKLIIPAVIGAVAVVVIAVVIFITSGILLSKQNKILQAVVNTFKGSTKLTETFEAVGLLASDSFTITANMEVDGDSVQAAFASKGDEMQLTGKVDISGIPELEGAIGIDSKQVRAKVDGVSDYVFVYSYTGKNDGFLVDQIGEDNLELVNTALKNLTSSKKREDIVKDMVKAVAGEFGAWKFEKADKEEFKIDGKKRNCAGYTTTITEDEMLALMEAVYKVVEQNVDLDEIEDVYSEIEDEFDGMPDIDVTFYLYDKMLAAILLEVDDEEIEIAFKGGETRWQNIAIEADGDEVLTFKGKTSDSVEKYALEVEGMEVFNVKYDSKTGELEAEAGRYVFGTAFALEANVKGNANKLSVALESIEVAGSSQDVDLQIELKSGAKMSKISGKEFDLGNADEDDLEDLVEEIEDILW